MYPVPSELSGWLFFSNTFNQDFIMSPNTPEQDCYFCKVTQGQADPFIFENRSFISIFDTSPVNPGHALIIPRRHVASIFDLNDMEEADYFDAIRGVKAVIESTGMVELYQNMIDMVSQQGRPKDHIETVLQLPFISEKPSAYTLGNNDGREAGRSIDHLHVILLPRYKGDVDNPRGGIRNIIPTRANYQRR
jgi:diadenosine tetraphosphate (Ap4A) HIT family hydrolase